MTTQPLQCVSLELACHNLELFAHTVETWKNDFFVQYVYIIFDSILQLLNQRMLEKLKKKWWDKNKVKCPKLENESEGISLNNIGGVFILIAGGAALALVCLGFELYFFKYKPKQASKNYGVAKSHSKANICQDENGARKQNGISNGGRAPSEDSQVTPSVERKNGSSLNIFNRQKRGVTFNLGDSL